MIGERRLGAAARARRRGSRPARRRADVWRGGRSSRSATDARDLPFTLTYLLRRRRHDGDAGGAQQRRRPAIPIAPASARRRRSGRGRSGACSTARRRDPMLVDLPPATAWPRGPWASAADAGAIVLPIAQQGQTRPAGVFIAGLNPHRPLDAEYRELPRAVRRPARGRPRQRAGLRSGAAARRGAGRDRSRQDDVLLATSATSSARRSR